jgi:hypothetical protein
MPITTGRRLDMILAEHALLILQQGLLKIPHSIFANWRIHERMGR